MAQFNFNSSAQGLDLTNALFLAQVSNLAYQPLVQIPDQLKTQFGLSQYKQFYYEPTDTLAFLASNDTAIILTFRGTELTVLRDWFVDGKDELIPSVEKGHIHRGFNEALGFIWNDLFKSLSDLINGADNNLKLWITGHSLGGALAVLAVDRLTAQHMDVQGLYTYGQPRVGDQDFVNNFNEKMGGLAFRFVNDGDIVPQVPYPPGYAHADAEAFFDNKGTLYTSDIFLHEIISISEDVALRSLETATSKNPTGVEDHFMDYYIQKISQNIPEPPDPDPFHRYINS